MATIDDVYAFLQLEMPLRGIFYKPADIGGYDGDPNDVAAPPVLGFAGAGVRYQQVTPVELIWRKNGDGIWYLESDEQVIDYAGGTLVMTNEYKNKIIRCLDVTTIQIGDSLYVNWTCGYIQVTALSIITFEGTGSTTLGVIDDFSSSPITTRSINAEAYVRKDTATHAIVSGALA